MKKKDIIDAIGDIDYDMVEDAEVRRAVAVNGAWIRIGAVAAIVTLVCVSIVVTLLLNREDAPNPPITPDVTSATVLDTKDNATTQGRPSGLVSGDGFASFEEYEQYEKTKGGQDRYYVPSGIDSRFALANISKRDNVYVAVKYNVVGEVDGIEALNKYDALRIKELICQYSLHSDSEITLEQYKSQGYEALEYQGRTIYRWDEHAEGNKNNRIIGYEIVFLEDDDLIFMHLPAIDTFENMMKYTDVIRVDIK